MIGTVGIRSLRATDIPALAAVLGRAYRSTQHFEPRLRAYLQMRRVATFVAELDGAAIGMVVGNDYGPLAYVSQMAVDTGWQRRGIGTSLMDALVAWLDERGFAATGLDATPSGEPLYRRYGFLDAGVTTVYRGGAATQWHLPRGVRPMVDADTSAVLELDARAFGADRSDVLRLLLADRDNRTIVADAGGRIAGYAVAQCGSDRLGPLVATSPALVAPLFAGARAHFRGEHELFVPDGSALPAALLAAHAYRPLRALAHLQRGVPAVVARGGICARINLGQG